MDLTIKGIPTQQIADRVKGFATKINDDYIENQAKILSKEKEAQVLTDKEAFRSANNLPLSKAVEDESGETIQ